MSEVSASRPVLERRQRPGSNGCHSDPEQKPAGLRAVISLEGLGGRSRRTDCEAVLARWSDVACERHIYKGEPVDSSAAVRAAVHSTVWGRVPTTHAAGEMGRKRAVQLSMPIDPALVAPWRAIELSRGIGAED